MEKTVVKCNLNVKELGGSEDGWGNLSCHELSLYHVSFCPGKRVELQGFGGFLGGLDSDRNLTGRESVFTEFSGLEVMFHVAPLMPFSASDPQQVSPMH